MRSGGKREEKGTESIKEGREAPGGGPKPGRKRDTDRSSEGTELWGSDLKMGQLPPSLLFCVEDSPPIIQMAQGLPRPHLLCPLAGCCWELSFAETRLQTTLAANRLTPGPSLQACFFWPCPPNPHSMMFQRISHKRKTR